MSGWREPREDDPAFVERTAAADDGAMVSAPMVDAVASPHTPASRSGRGASAPPHAASERADIARRVAAFRDRQRLIRQQREDYCDTVLAQTRAALRVDPGFPRN